MKQTLLAALLAAVAASALTLLLAGVRPSSAPPAGGPVPQGLADLVAEIAALRKEMAAARAPAATADRGPILPPSPASAATAPTGAPPAEAAPIPAENTAPEGAPAVEFRPEADEPVVREERSAIARAPEVVESLRTMTKWDDNADIRKTWMLTSEENVLSRWGKPDEIFASENGAECWNYRTQTGTQDEDGDPEWQDISLEMVRGRLVRVYD